ncbi:putative sphingosine-1-phosphate lyase [Candidatus Thermoflexus japonica]|uniref:Putative sphingosine-1-phosphate lyase n=1 Tax=Candidatus Thermoflexus japonica TaxID=2035417 RepID=A0A2H5Y859_9CHLR|nr:putative sphingosine-1-phosphate lyase [Candidatus Thermoflexus japonica]
MEQKGWAFWLWRMALAFGKTVRRWIHGLLSRLERPLRAVPGMGRRLEAEYAAVLQELKLILKPYQDLPTFSRLPPEGESPDRVFQLLRTLAAREEARWRKGYASGAVYHGGDAHIAFLNRVYALFSQANPLHPDLWPSVARFEAEIVAMTARMLGADQADEEIVGTVTSCGTESILLAMKAYRDWAREIRGIDRPEIVLPVTAHAAFEKAAHLFGLRLVYVPVDEGYRADVQAMARAVTRRTIVLVASAPSFPHGIIDPVPEIARLAQAHGIGCHVDACLGGFVLPWAERLGYPVPPFDFRVRGVTSISVDPHKYGYAPKGISVILYRGRQLRRFQYFAATDWPGGLYATPTLLGSRPGGLIAAAWAAMVTMGEQGYLEATRAILEAAARIRDGIRQIPELEILGDPLWVIAFTSKTIDIYRVLEQMGRRGWSLNALQHPPAVHLAVTLRHTQPGVAERFLQDLRESVAWVREHPEERGELAPVYGMAATLPFRGVVRDLLYRYLDLLYET